MNRECLAKLTNEVRTAFKTEEEIDLVSVNKLTYMLACLDEALRVYPPVSMGLPRVTPKGGATICGKFVPENVSWSPILHLRVITDDSATRPSWRFTSGLSTTTRSISKTRTDSTPRDSWGMRSSLRITGKLSNLSTLVQEIAWGGSELCHPTDLPGNESLTAAVWPMLK